MVDKLMISEKLNRVAFEYCPSGIIVLDRDRNVLEVNPAIITISEFSIDELFSYSIDELFVNTSRKILNEVFTRGINEKTVRREAELLCFGAKKKKVSIEGVRISEEAFMLFITETIVHDKSKKDQNGHSITSPDNIKLSYEEQSKAINEERDIESELIRYKEMIEATSDFIGIADKDGKVMYLNKALRNLRGINQEDISRLEIANFHPPEVLKILFEEAIPESIEKGIWKGESKILDQNDRAVPISQICLSHKNEKGEVDYISTIARDISDLKETENALISSQKRLYQAQQIAKLGYWTLDVAENKISGSDEIFKQLNIGVGKNNYNDFLKCIHSLDRQLVISKTKRGISNSEKYNVEYRITRRDGVEVWVQTFGEAVQDKNGKTVQMIGTFQDITQRKKTEKMLIQTNEELEMFFYRTSHDLKSPLASSKGLINLARNSQNPEEVKYYLNFISKAVDKLDNILTDLIQVTRVRRGELEFKDVNLGQTIDSICESYPEFDNGELKLRKDIEVDNLWTDQSYLNIIIRNLVSNAIKYRHSGQDSYLTCTSKSDGDRVTILMEDNGIGIRESAIGGIFEMFFRGTDEQETGAGLGLFIVKNAVERLSGNISVHSEWGKGTTFTITLPVQGK